MSNYVIHKDICSGCKLCKSICPHNAIEFKIDKDGFWYPEKNENCINCGLCEKKCPMVSKINYETKIEQQVFCVKHKNEDIVNKSTSGGAFSAIVEAFCDSNYVIFGARYNENFEVIHSYIENMDELDVFRKSKFVQSDSNNIYSTVKDFLQRGKKVLFSGTPCQVAALRNFLQKDYENLLTVDIICHGAPNPKVFEKYKRYLEEKYKSSITTIEFRHKGKGIKNLRNIYVKFENNKEKIFYNKNDLYLKCFYNKLLYRNACGKCKFANPKRYSDITIGDAWGIEKVYSDLNTHRGQSMVIINTKKGQEIFDKLKINIHVRNLFLDFAINENSQFREPTEIHKKSSELFQKIDEIDFLKLVDQICSIKFTTKLKNKIVKILRRKNGKKKI